MADPRGALMPVLAAMDIKDDPSLAQPSFNGRQLDEVYPWGTIRTPTGEVNHKTALELSPAERDEISWRAQPFLDAFSYTDFLSGES